MAAGEEFPLFGGGRITDEWEQVGFDAGEIQERIAFGGSSIGGDIFAGPLLFEEEGHEVVFHLFGSGLESALGFERKKSGGFFLSQNSLRAGFA